MTLLFVLIILAGLINGILSPSCTTQILDPTSASSPRRDSDAPDKCGRVKECVSLRVDLEAATRGLRIAFGVKLSNLEKALLPTGTVRVLEVYFRGSVSVRMEVRRDFPFVGMVSYKYGTL